MIQMGISIRVKMNKNGNSMKMTIPVPVLWVLGWEKGDILELDVKKSTLLVKKAPH